ncbi:FAD-dependent oxidoreductase [Calycomorphotria hydatis]|uniref:Xanthan lyase n=1 Tax=Calycomorphotria hydatis TaxID=2528027 RepID=A0A517T3W3_9PLAN|nr:FAD-dependent oxidoreductase [Calycomorphotria hydatis]QDT63059.1 Xanthan lyase precursor [Calycomorphotria hydatis]
MPTKLLSSLLCLTIAIATASAGDQPQEYDLVVYGGTSAGVIAAVQAKKMGKTAVIVGPDIHLGGLSSGGLGWTDSGKKEAIGGISREFYQRIKKHYDNSDAWRQQKPEQYSRYRKNDDAMWVFEPHVAEQVFEDYVAEYKIPVLRDEYLDRKNGVKMDGDHIKSITMLSGKTFAGKMFVDATYEGDLLATAGVSFTVGRESNSQYGETLNGVQATNAHSHQFTMPISPYVVPNDPSSGLLPRIEPGPPAADGSGDHRVQAYCFRTCMTNAPENLTPFPKPDNYDPQQYELLGRVLDAGWRGVWNKFDPAPNKKTDTNNHGPFSFDNIGFNYDYPEASYERRKEIIAEHEDYQQGLLWYLANDPRVPEDVREKTSKWGLAADEFTDNGNWPHQLYIREARRMVSDYVMSEQDCRRIRIADDSVGLGSYNMDSHNTQRYVDANGHARNEGDIQRSPGGSYAISYSSIVPKKGEADNLLVPVCISSSHIAYGSIRMEPVFMILGQSAATAAVMAIDEGIAVQDVDYAKLQPRLVEDGQQLEPSSNRPKLAQNSISPKSLKGIVVDDDKAIYKGEWIISSSIPEGRVGYTYRHAGDKNDKLMSATFRTALPKAGKYDVRISYSANPNRASNVPVTIHHANGETKKLVNQRKRPGNTKSLVSLGVYSFDDDAEVVITNEEANGYVIVDAVQFLPVE